MKAKASIITLIFFTFFIAISLTNISSAMVGPDWSPEAHRLWLFKNFVNIGLATLIAYGAVLPVVIFFWKRKCGNEKLKTLLKIDRQEKRTIHENIALIIGIIAISSIWWQVMPHAYSMGSSFFSFFLFGFPIPFSIFAMIFCSFNKHNNRLIDLGLKLSIIAFLFSLIIFAELITLYVG